ncbi:MAG TPA: toll/interleukin-1 receptor domain-containing protein [Verrucomicrobiae bacterium]|jgi:hypothetical protein|nr:toll/interleukin-1 receptor domain-containing protein [Verrucomicrobiae bacterium]
MDIHNIQTVPNISEQRTKITAEQRVLLDEIWNQFLSTRQWPIAWEFNSRHHKPQVRRIFQPLNASIVVETNGGPDGTNLYQLQLLGALLTTDGKVLEQLLLRYLELVRKLYQTAPKRLSVESSEIQQALRLSNDETILLGRLVNLGGLYSLSANFDRNGDPKVWSVGILKSVEDFPITGPLDGALEKLVFQGFERGGPVFMDDRNFGAQYQPSVFDIPGGGFKVSMSPVSSTQSSKLIFVSHSSRDQDLAEAIVDLLCSALSLRRADFMCTSVDGSKLRGGDETDDVLRDHIREVPAFLSLLTPHAVGSTYVLFELGARWGHSRHHIPLLAKGAGTEVLKEPLKSKNALQLNRESEVFQLVEDLGHVLNCKIEPPNSYMSKVRNVVQIAGTAAPKVSDVTQKSQTREELEELEISILKLLAECADWVSAAELTPHLGVKQTKAEYYLTKMEQARLISGSHFYTGKASEYKIAHAGREYLVRNGLV